MAHYKFDLVQETSTSTGATTMALAGAVTRRRRFGDVLANADTCYVFIEHASAAEWQICLATWNTGHSLTLGAVLASSTGVAVTFSAGTKTISMVAPASKSVVMDNNGDVSVTRDLAVGRNLTVAGTAVATGALSSVVSVAAPLVTASHANPAATAGVEVVAAVASGADNGSAVGLRTKYYRTASALGHASAEYRMQRHVDATLMGYLGWGDQYLSGGINAT